LDIEINFLVSLVLQMAEGAVRSQTRYDLATPSSERYLIHLKIQTDDELNPDSVTVP
jgi:hypothetical protein